MAADDPQAVAAAGAPLADGGGLPEERVHLEECLVDGLITFAAENASGRFFLFTQVEEDGPPRPGRQTPAETGRQGLFEAIGRTYQAVFPEGNANKAGQLYGKVGKPLSAIFVKLKALRFALHVPGHVFVSASCATWRPARI